MQTADRFHLKYSVESVSTDAKTSRKMGKRIASLIPKTIRICVYEHCKYPVFGALDSALRALRSIGIMSHLYAASERAFLRYLGNCYS